MKNKFINKKYTLVKESLNSTTVIVYLMSIINASLAIAFLLLRIIV